MKKDINRTVRMDERTFDLINRVAADQDARFSETLEKLILAGAIVIRSMPIMFKIVDHEQISFSN